VTAVIVKVLVADPVRPLSEQVTVTVAVPATPG
jgi:hypothetical protein